MPKLIVIIGITGNQGSSVAYTFLRDPTWRIRGLTRTLNSATSQHLSSLGIQMIEADLHDPSTLAPAFEGANLIFSATDFWTPFFTPSNASRAAELGISIGKYAYELEAEQGRNIVDAVAKVVKGLDEVGFVASTLCNANETSGGKYKELWHFDSKASVFPGYVREKYPEVAKKTSCLHTGYFYTSWRYMPRRWFAKLPDGSVQMQSPTSPDTLIPHLNPRTDVGPFVRAMLQLPPGSTVMAASEWCTWPDWIKTWGEATGVKTSYKQVNVEDFDKEMPGGAGKEIGEMFEFSSTWGYNANQKDTLMTWDLEKVGVHVPTMSLKEYCEKEDWVAAGILPI